MAWEAESAIENRLVAEQPKTVGGTRDDWRALEQGNQQRGVDSQRNQGTARARTYRQTTKGGDHS